VPGKIGSSSPETGAPLMPERADQVAAMSASGSSSQASRFGARPYGSGPGAPPARAASGWDGPTLASRVAVPRAAAKAAVAAAARPVTPAGPAKISVCIGRSVARPIGGFGGLL
jgi:hypothetical protein